MNSSTKSSVLRVICVDSYLYLKYLPLNMILNHILSLSTFSILFGFFQPPDEEIEIDDGTSKRSPPENERKCADNKPDVVMSIPNMMEMNTVGGILVNMPHVITHDPFQFPSKSTFLLSIFFHRRSLFYYIKI